MIGPDELITGLVPPPRFDAARFQTYRPNPAEPSQQAAVAALTGFAERIANPPRKGLFRRTTPAAGGYYLDGGFGVGKTHLLASLWHSVPGPKAYGTFVEYTHLVGALGFNETVAPADRASVAGRRRIRAGRSRRHHADDPTAGPTGRDRGAPGRHVEHAARQTR